MNQKYTVKAPNGKTVFCILSSDTPKEEQLSTVFSLHGGGVSVRYTDKEILVMDYFHDDPMASFPILSIEDTALPVSLKWCEEQDL